MTLTQTAQHLYQQAIVIDSQLGFEEAMPWSFAEKWQLVDCYAAAGFTALTLTLANEETSTDSALAYVAKVRQHILDRPDQYVIATTKADIVLAKQQHKMALRLMFQGTNPIGKNLELLNTFQTLGISSLVLAYNIRTPMGDGVIEESDAGLSHLGKQFVAEMNRLGLIIDVSHTGVNTSMEAMSLTTAPMVFSHSAVFGLAAHVRNINDAQIQAVANTGGVIGISGVGLLLGDAKVDTFVDHIDYVARLVGPQHVAIGLDNLYFADQFASFMSQQRITHPQAYANAASDANGWPCLQPEDMVHIVERLLQRHYAETDILGILGGNILRLM